MRFIFCIVTIQVSLIWWSQAVAGDSGRVPDLGLSGGRHFSPIGFKNDHIMFRRFRHFQKAESTEFDLQEIVVSSLDGEFERRFNNGNPLLIDGDSELIPTTAGGYLIIRPDAIDTHFDPDREIQPDSLKLYSYNSAGDLVDGYYLQNKTGDALRVLQAKVSANDEEALFIIAQYRIKRFDLEGPQKLHFLKFSLNPVSAHIETLRHSTIDINNFPKYAFVATDIQFLKDGRTLVVGEASYYRHPELIGDESELRANLWSVRLLRNGGVDKLYGAQGMLETTPVLSLGTMQPYFVEEGVIVRRPLKQYEGSNSTPEGKESRGESRRAVFGSLVSYDLQSDSDAIIRLDSVVSQAHYRSKYFIDQNGHLLYLKPKTLVVNDGEPTVYQYELVEGLKHRAHFLQFVREGELTIEASGKIPRLVQDPDLLNAMGIEGNCASALVGSKVLTLED